MKEVPGSPATLGDLLRLALPLNTAVPAGRGYMRREIHWVVVLNGWQALKEQIRTGDLVLVPPSLLGTQPPGVLSSALQEMVNGGAVAAVFFGDVPEGVKQAANQLDFPVLVAPADVVLRDVHQSVAALLLDRHAQITERGMQLYRQLSEMSREGQGLAAMTDLISQLTGKVAVVQDKRLEIQALSRPVNSNLDETTLREALLDRETLPPVLRNRKAAAQTPQTHWQQLLPIQGVNVARLLSPIISGDRARGYLSVIGPPGELDLLDTLAVEHGAAACALEMAKAKAVSEAKKALRGNFLEGLLAGSMAPAEIERLAARLDHETGQPHAVLAFAWESHPAPSLRRLETAVNWLLSSHSRPALVHIYGSDHVCVFQALRDKDVDMATAQELARRLREHLQAEQPQSRLVAGLGGPAETLADWPRAHEQAVQAMQLGRRLRLNQLVEYNSLGIYQLLSQLEGTPAVQSFCNRIIGPLAEYDQRHRSSLVQTVDAYFAHHGNISQTAEALFVHRNTLLYRLDRIQELTGQDLNQADMRLALHLALKLWQLRPSTNA